jgi:aspartyl protease family protein
MSSGSRSLIGEALSWVVGLALCAVALIYHQELRAFVWGQAGLPSPAEFAERLAGGDRTEPRRTARAGSVELRMTSDGHFHAEAEVNGRSIDVLVDTGASMVALTWEDAERAGIYVKDSDFTHRAQTANGSSRIAPVVIDRISIGDITVRNVKGAVAERGRLFKTLLGMSFLGRTSWSMKSGVLVLDE